MRRGPGVVTAAPFALPTAAEITPATLIDRQRELAEITRMLDLVSVRGQALLLHGDPGSGKSRLLRETEQLARERGMCALTTRGIRSELAVAFSGLQRLLRPVMGSHGGLTSAQRQALSSAFSGRGSTPGLFHVALAALNLLAECGAQRPLVVLIDDAHWLDSPTKDVLTLIARRLESEPIILILACQEGFNLGFEQALPAIRLNALSDEAAVALVDSWYPDLRVSERQRLLGEAQGNPLALLELPLAWRQPTLAAPAAPCFPVTERLVRAFGARALSLPPSTRSLLLVAAINDRDSLAEILAGTALLHPEDSATEASEAAIAAGLISVDETTLHFRNPLVRCAVRQAASPSARQSAHAALAETLKDDLDRAVWHRAACALGPDESLAGELEAAAWRARRRHGTAAAIASLKRSGELSEPGSKGARLLAAAQLAAEMGNADEVRDLLADVTALRLNRRDELRMLWLREFVREARGMATIGSILAVADELAENGETQIALNALYTAAQKAHWHNREESVGQQIVTLADRLDVPEDDAMLLAVYAFAAPGHRGSIVVMRASRLSPADLARPGGSLRSEAEDNHLYAIALSVLQEHDAATRFQMAAIEQLRQEGRFGLLARSLSSQAVISLAVGDWTRAVSTANECYAVSAETDQPRHVAVAQLVRAALAANHGEAARAEDLIADAEQILAPLETTFVRALIEMARTAASLAAGAYDDAFAHAHRVFDPADCAYHAMVGTIPMLLIDLADAALQAAAEEQGQAAIERALQSPGRLPEGIAAYARAVLYNDERSDDLFRRALERERGASGFVHARLLLGHGTWLRRQRRAPEARTQLRAAAQAFDAIGARPWCERAREELRASGETNLQRRVGAHDDLSPQELQIAALVAQGLTNREIGERLFLSHRTVGSQLYRLFPKLGISSRSEVRELLRHRADQLGLSASPSNSPDVIAELLRNPTV
jgi:DNA-binding CsgD family transcriptional regulator